MTEKIDDTALSCWGRSDRNMFAYVRGKQPPNYPMPAIPYAYFESAICTISVWPGAMQIRISDEYLAGKYTGFGVVITFNFVSHECEMRWDDFD